MLAASKDRFAFEIKRKALQLRQQELELVVQRYNNLAGLASIAAGFAFDSMVELEIPEDTWEELHEHDLEWLEPLFYIGASCALSLAMYVVAVASFTVVFGHRLALLGGKTNSLDKAVAIMLKQALSLPMHSACRCSLCVKLGWDVMCGIIAHSRGGPGRGLYSRRAAYVLERNSQPGEQRVGVSLENSRLKSHGVLLIVPSPRQQITPHRNWHALLTPSTDLKPHPHFAAKLSLSLCFYSAMSFSTLCNFHLSSYFNHHLPSLAHW
eukprot:329786-Pleurochrysis_carterae.AAC.5